MRGRNSSTDVFLVTAATEVDILREALRGGIFYYILKSLAFERLQASLKKHTDHLVKLGMLGSVIQTDVDTLLPRSAKSEQVEPPPQRLSKGTDGLTLETVQGVFVKQTESLSVEEVGE